MLARDVMSTPPVTVRKEDDLETAARRMLEKGVGSVLVVDDAYKVVGIITESDFVARDRPLPFSLFEMPQLFGQWVGKGDLEKIYQEARDDKVATVMSAPVVQVDEDTPLQKVAELMMQHKIKRVAVVRDGQAVGIVSRHDLLKAVAHPTE